MAELDVTKLLQESKYLFLLRLAPPALRTLAEASQRIANIGKFVDDIDARCGFVATSGKYDLITLFYGDDKQAYQFNLYLRSRPQFDAVDMVKLESSSPQQYLSLIRALANAE